MSVAVPSQAGAALALRRLGYAELFAAADDAPAPLGALGVLGYGHGGPGVAIVPVAVLAGTPCADAWFGAPGAALQAGEHDGLRWRSDGRWLWGELELPDDAEPGLLAERAYARLFAVLRAQGCGHLYRVWHYLPRLTAIDDGEERYRRFNRGRQRAFLAHDAPAFEGAPAACALGTWGGPLCVRFLAGRTPALAIENPRQVSAYRYPPQYGERPPTFSRAVVVPVGGGQGALLVSGTASIVGHESRHADDVQAQVAETLANLQAVAEAANERAGGRYDVRALQHVVYVKHRNEAAAVQAAFERGLGAEAAQRAVFAQADICRAELRVEIEAHGLGPIAHNPKDTYA